jgi:retron-type reverse transcriptase
MQKRFIISYEDTISIENLLEAWEEFIRGKRKRIDVQEFELHLMQNVLELHHELAAGIYQHGGYQHFKISDPKPRDIHKATVRDRLLHHALYRKLYPFFDRTFIADSYSCREGKGTHKATNRFRAFAYQVSKNDTRTCWVLKCDIRKFFASIDHQTLFNILEPYISDERTQSLIVNIVGSFNSGTVGKGLPLGNLTSQLLVNIYMNEFDQFMKHKLKVTHYIRYADDFVLLSPDKSYLTKMLLSMEVFLRDKLKLEMHPNKVFIKTFASGIDFLGWVHFPNYRVLRTATKQRMFRTLEETAGKKETVESYLGMLSHGNTARLRSNALFDGGGAE